MGMMFARGAWAFLVLCASTVVSQSSPDYQFTMGVTSPAPVPGQPFTITWTGGAETDVVYIVLDYYFGDTPNQNIIYETTDILSNAPNNGSWVYNVPGNIFPGRYSFQIGANPFLLSGISGIFSITPSQTFPVSSAPPATTNTAFQSYNGCGLPPLPDFTYTGYQPPCTTTTNGVVETLYPIVPVSDSSVFFGSVPKAAATVTIPILTSLSTSISSASINTAFATGVYAQALQCPSPVTPIQTRITGSSATTILSLVGCGTAAATTTRLELFPLGVCHASGYSTFSVTSSISMCCPSGWSTTPLNNDPLSVFCYTSTSAGAVEKRMLSTETLETSPYTIIEIEGLAFTRAGIVENDADSTGANTLAASQTGSSSAMSKGLSTQTVKSSTGITTTTTGSVPTATGNDGGARLEVESGVWGVLGLVGLWGIL